MGFTVNAGLDEDYKSDREEIKTDTESSHSEEEDDQVFDKLEHARPEETPYSENKIEELGQVWLDSWRLRPNKKMPVFRVIHPYLNLLMKHRIFQVFWK